MATYIVRDPRGKILGKVQASTLDEAAVKADAIPEPAPIPATAKATPLGRRVELEQ